MVIALYAPVGSGKSTVLKLFAGNGWTTIDQDVVAHNVLNAHSADIERLFGSDVIENGVPNRKKIGSQVFSDLSKLKQLEDFLYPIIRQETKVLIKGNTLIEGANIYKVLDKYPVDKTLTIFVPVDILKARLIARGHTEEWIARVLVAQQPLFNAQAKADLSLDNSGTEEDLRLRVNDLLRELSSSL